MSKLALISFVFPYNYSDIFVITSFQQRDYAISSAGKLGLFFKLIHAARGTLNSERINWLCFFNSIAQHAVH